MTNSSQLGLIGRKLRGFFDIFFYFEGTRPGCNGEYLSSAPETGPSKTPGISQKIIHDYSTQSLLNDYFYVKQM